MTTQNGELYTWKSNGHNISWNDISAKRGWHADDLISAADIHTPTSSGYTDQGQGLHYYGVNSVPGNQANVHNDTSTAYPNRDYVTNAAMINEGYQGMIGNGQMLMSMYTRNAGGSEIATIPKGCKRLVLVGRGGGGGKGGGGGGARAMGGSDAWMTGGDGGYGEGGRFAYAEYTVPTNLATGNYSVQVNVGYGGGGGNGGNASHGYSGTHQGQYGNAGGQGQSTTIYFPTTGQTILTANGGTGGNGGAGGRVHGPQFGNQGKASNGTQYNIGYNKQDYRKNNLNTPSTWNIHYDYSRSYDSKSQQRFERGRGGINDGGGGAGDSTPNTAAKGGDAEGGYHGFAKIFYRYGD